MGMKLREAEPVRLLVNLPSPLDDVGVWLSKSFMSAVDWPTHIHHARVDMCLEGMKTTRSMYISYVFLMLPYFWILATPIATFIFGAYLTLSSLAGRHMDEAFSSLRIQHYKNFLRLHI